MRRIDVEKERGTNLPTADRSQEMNYNEYSHGQYGHQADMGHHDPHGSSGYRSHDGDMNHLLMQMRHSDPAGIDQHHMGHGHHQAGESYDHHEPSAEQPGVPELPPQQQPEKPDDSDWHVPSFRVDLCRSPDSDETEDVDLKVSGPRTGVRGQLAVMKLRLNSFYLFHRSRRFGSIATQTSESRTIYSHALRCCILTLNLVLSVPRRDQFNSHDKDSLMFFPTKVNRHNVLPYLNKTCLDFGFKLVKQVSANGLAAANCHLPGPRPHKSRDRG